MSKPDRNAPVEGPPPDRARKSTPMSLLSGIAENSLDPAYRVAAERRSRVAGGATGPRSSRGQGPSKSVGSEFVGLAAETGAGADPTEPARSPLTRWTQRAVIGALIALLAFGSVVAAQSLRTSEQAEGVGRLRSAVESKTVRVTQLERGNADLRSRITTKQKRAVGPASPDGAGEIGPVSAAAGATPVRGPGLELTLDDAPPVGGVPGDDEAATVNRVTDRDVQRAVNALWNAGAEAISINGQRLTVTSAIRSAGDAILVDFRPLSPPYVISAIGEPAEMSTAFMRSPDARNLDQLSKDYGIGVETKQLDQVDIPARVLSDLRYAIDVPETATGPSAPSTPGKGRSS